MNGIDWKERFSAAGREFAAMGAVRRSIWVAQAALLVAVVTLHGAALCRAFASPYSNFRDFECYYTAASLYNKGLNPYDRTQNILTFLYLPTTLWFFKPFTWLPLQEAARLWLLLKGVALVWLVVVWQRAFSLPLGVRQGLLIAAGLTFAVVQDLVTGNVSLVEQLLLWGALSALLKRRYWQFALNIVLVSQFKLLFLLFVPCLFLLDSDGHGRRKQWQVALGTIVGFVCTLGLSFLIRADWPRAMAANVLHIDYNGGNYDPCSRAFFQDLLQTVRPASGSATLKAGSLALHGLFALGVLVVSALVLRKYRRQHDSYEAAPLLLFACLIYALILPRFKLYSYILVLPPAMYVAARLKRWPAAALFLLCLLPGRNFLYPLDPLPRIAAAGYDLAHIPPLISNYTTLFALFGLWLWFAAELCREKVKRSLSRFKIGRSRSSCR